MRPTQQIPIKRVQSRNPRTLSREKWVPRYTEFRKGDNYTIPILDINMN